MADGSNVADCGLRAWGWSNVESIVVPAAGHYIADEQPKALAALIDARAGQNAARGK
jgi:pimeloyl-ACP methyl ester carboxylesterase